MPAFTINHDYLWAYTMEAEGFLLPKDGGHTGKHRAGSNGTAPSFSVKIERHNGTIASYLELCESIQVMESWQLHLHVQRPMRTQPQIDELEECGRVRGGIHGGIASARIQSGTWARIDALLAAGRPLPADLPAWKAKTTAGVRERINALEAAGEELPADLAAWKAKAKTRLDRIYEHYVKQYAEVAAAGVPSADASKSFETKIATARAKVQENVMKGKYMYKRQKGDNGAFHWDQAADTKLINAVEAAGTLTSKLYVRQ